MDAEKSTLRDMQIFYSIIRHIKRKVNNRDTEFFGDKYAKERIEISDLIVRSVEAAESNSVILMGPPGCGKTALVNNVLKDLQNGGILNSENSAIVRLNGLVQTDDNLALRDIARQLKAEFSEDQKTTKSFQENLSYIFEQLKQNNGSQLCVIFVLDDFHLFCRHKNQYLLYNLFDIAQSAKAPICVLGLTYYTDVMDLLEKRVLSRFSHRLIQMTKPLTIEDRIAAVGEIFTLGADVLPDTDEIYKFVWNSRVEELIESKAVEEAIQKHLDLEPCEGRFRNILFQLISSISFEVPLLSVQNLLDVFTSSDSQAAVLSRLSALEIALIIAIKHYSVSFEGEPFNFEMILTHYIKLIQQQATTMVRERAVILKAFQRLQELEIVVPLRRGVGSSANMTGKVPIEYQLYTFSLTEEQVTEGVKLNKTIPTEFAQWASGVDIA